MSLRCLFGHKLEPTLKMQWRPMKQGSLVKQFWVNKCQRRGCWYEFGLPEVTTFRPVGEKLEKEADN